jgi:hypothetical protein
MQIAIIENDLVLITQRKDYAIHFGASCHHLMRHMRLIPNNITPAIRVWKIPGVQVAFSVYTRPIE